ncbi:MAG: DUF805 domain-containing protein [bacterium]|nr:DUF805 domain-containing protein [bacterium]
MKKILNLFRGRISRKTFFLSYLLLLALGFLYFGLAPIEEDQFEKYTIIWTYGLIVLLIPFFAIALSLHIRRLHDIGLSGFFVLAQILFIILGTFESWQVMAYYLDILYWLLLVLKTGEDKDNEYGLMPSSKIKFWEVAFNLEK